MKNIELFEDGFDLEFATNFCRNDASGAITTFLGTVRGSGAEGEVKNLFFEAYKPMAIKEMDKLIEEARMKWPINRVVFWHRLGEVGVGKDAVVVVVATPHREEGFKACQFLIDELKKSVPIWKKESFENGHSWVSAHP